MVKNGLACLAVWYVGFVTPLRNGIISNSLNLNLDCQNEFNYMEQNFLTMCKTSNKTVDKPKKYPRKIIAIHEMGNREQQQVLSNQESI